MALQSSLCCVQKFLDYLVFFGSGRQLLVIAPSDYAVGMVKVTNPRVDQLTALYNPKKTKHAEIECTLAPAPPKDAKPREQWLGKLKDMDAFCHVVRAFEDPAVFHVSGSVDPVRDIEVMNLELAITEAVGASPVRCPGSSPISRAQV